MEEITCVICFARLELNEKISATFCGHVFHFECMRQWREKEQTCPNCRSEVSNENIHPLFFNSMGTPSKVDPLVLNLQDEVNLLKKQLEKEQEGNSDMSSLLTSVLDSHASEMEKIEKQRNIEKEELRKIRQVNLQLEERNRELVEKIEILEQPSLPKNQDENGLISGSEAPRIFGVNTEEELDVPVIDLTQDENFIAKAQVEKLENLGHLVSEINRRGQLADVTNRV